MPHKLVYHGQLLKRLAVTGTANTAIAASLGLAAELKLNSKKFAKIIRGDIVVTVQGGNADGDDTFVVYISPAITLSYCDLLRETIAAASLTQNATVHRNCPYHTDATKGCDANQVIIRDDEDIWISATAGGANVVYSVSLDMLIEIWEIVEEKSQGSPTAIPSRITRDGW